MNGFQVFHLVIEPNRGTGIFKDGIMASKICNMLSGNMLKTAGAVDMD